MKRFIMPVSNPHFDHEYVGGEIIDHNARNAKGNLEFDMSLPLRALRAPDSLTDAEQEELMRMAFD